MTSERWQQVNDLFQLAAERAPEERTTFLQTACHGDEGLRREVESLIAYYERAENFIESPAFEVVPELLTDDRAGAIVGESIAHYRIESLIGVGGMGEVYLARDERLGRKVALKFLPEQLTANNTQLSRFKSEARAASALNHPNILTVYEIGTEGNLHFIATEFIEGVTLRATLARGRMSVHDALEVAVQVASALAAAHKTGVVHRDIKPENIMIRPDGYVKVLDFGLAKLTEQKLASDNQDLTITNTQHTLAGMLVGTPRYMSPEQTRGQPADARSDIWSLGAVIYEMVGGVPAFSGATPSDCIASILKTEAPALSRVAPAAPTELQSILHKALRKNRDERYQTIAEMLADLRSLKGKLERAASAPKLEPAWLWTAAVAAIVLIGIGSLFFARYRSLPVAARSPISPATAQIPEKSVAVLPFENRSRDPDNVFFTDGVQDEILTDLARIADLKVISRTSVMQYKTGAKRNLRQIADELGVMHVVEGSVQRAGNRVRVNAQLIDARTDAHLWAQTYDRDLADVFAIQSEIAKAIADQLQANLSPSEKSAIEQPPTSDIPAFAFYTHAKSLLLTAAASSTIKADMQQAVDLLNQAVARDPSFLQAYCQLAYGHDGLYFFGLDRSQSRLGLAEAAIQAASRLSPDAGETHLVRAQHLYWGYRDYRPALAELEIAGERLPNDSRVIQLKGFIERRQGRWRDAIQDLKRAIELDPRNVLTLQQTAQVYQTHRRYAEEKSIMDQVLAFEPNDAAIKVQEAFAELNSKADTQPLHQMVESIRATNPGALPSIAGNWLICALAERDAATAKDALTVSGENPVSFDILENIYFNRPFVEGGIARMTKEDARARTAFAAARAEQEKLVRAGPDNASALCVLGLIDAALGRKEEALREGRHAVELLPVERDAQTGPQMHKYLAMIAAWVGDKDLACEQLAIAISKPSGLSYGQLKLLPFWDPLRGDPRFEKLVEEARQPIALVNSPAPEETLNIAPEKSIAVLPFENRSRDPDNAYFAEGVQDEILTRLSKIADLKVISRTSTQHYKSTPANVPEIAKQLGVAHILEGSVQKVADQVRVNVQLINAQTDSHLWADTFDRKLTDIFSVESDVAKAIAEQLQAKLTGREEQVIAAKPTDNPEAYDAYLHGLAYTLKTTTSPTNALAAQKYLKEAVRLDPKFALSWALLSYADASGYIVQSLQPTVALREEARQAAETALTLQPNLGEAVVAKGYYHYACLKDYDTAVRYFEQARPLLPNSSQIAESLAYVTRRRGQWDQSESYFNEAERLDPRNVTLLNEHAASYIVLRRFPEALRKLDQVLDITPDDANTLTIKAGIAQAEGDLPRAAALLAPLHLNADDSYALETQVYQEILERRPAQFTPRLKEILTKPDPALGSINGQLRFWLGWAQEIGGDHAGAQASWSQARSELESFLKEQPDNYLLIGYLALTNMGLGDKEAALALSERAMAALPIEKDAVTGPIPIEILARVAAQMGEPDRAIAALQKLLSVPSAGVFPAGPLTPALLRLDPMFDPLRNDSRFQELVAPAGRALSPPAQAPEKSIAVLPFENLSEEKANEYFAAGVQDEILTRLAAVRDLKVISRTSTAKYKSKPDNLKKVAQELGVSTILEGSVQKAGDKVRINVQLIDARTDTHLWAKTYDRDLKDVFAVESEVSQEIADTLRVKLSAAQSATMAHAPTDDTEAYDLFLRGEYEFHQAGISLDAGAAADRADAFYRRALARDPNFVGPAVQLARNRLYRHWYVSPLAPAELDEVKSIIDRTLARTPNSPEAHLALGLFFYWGHRQYEMALMEFERTLELQPNNVDAQAYCAWIHRRRGEWERSLADSQRAQELDPRDASIPQNSGLTHLALRRWKEAEAAEFRALALDPQNTVAAVLLVNSRLSGTGDASSARRALDDFPEASKSLTTTLYSRRGVSSGGEVTAITGIWAYLDVIQRRFTDAFQAFEKEAGNDHRGHLELLAGRVALRVLAGQAEAAKSVGEETLPWLEARLRERPDDTFAMTELSWIYLAVGRNADALRLSRQAADSISIEKDALDGPVFQTGLAQIEARAGAPEEAIKRLRRLLSIPAGHRISRARLKSDPVWDPIRNRPDFQQLLSGPEQIGANK